MQHMLLCPKSSKRIGAPSYSVEQAAQIDLSSIAFFDRGLCWCDLVHIFSDLLALTLCLDLLHLPDSLSCALQRLCKTAIVDHLLSGVPHIARQVAVLVHLAKRIWRHMAQHEIGLIAATSHTRQ